MITRDCIRRGVFRSVAGPGQKNHGLHSQLQRMSSPSLDLSQPKKRIHVSPIVSYGTLAHRIYNAIFFHFRRCLAAGTPNVLDIFALADDGLPVATYLGRQLARLAVSSGPSPSVGIASAPVRSLYRPEPARRFVWGTERCVVV